jgi:hypothetical protein
MKITSGSCRMADRMASWNESTSTPTSRWLTAAIRSGCRTSIGSSIVTMWQGRVALIRSIIADSVVVFPEPVGPVTRTSPRGRSARSSTINGSPSSSAEGEPMRTSRMTRLIEPRCRNTFTRKRPTFDSP